MTAATPAWAQVEVDLTGRTVVVVGGGGGVGEGVVRALLARGATVVATGRDRGWLDAAAARVPSPRLHVTALDALADDLGADVQQLADRHGPFAGVVVAVASWGEQDRRPLLETTDTQWAALLAGNTTSVFRLYRALVPHLTPSGALVQLGGYSADLPFPGAAGVALTGAASKSMTRTLAAELSGRGPRVHSVILGMVRTRARQAAGVDDEGWLTGDEIGAHVAALVAGTSPLSGLDLQYLVDRRLGPQPVPPTRAAR